MNDPRVGVIEYLRDLSDVEGSGWSEDDRPAWDAVAEQFVPRPGGSDVITVPEDHGAAGDGSTDDTTALQAWLDDSRPVKVLPDNIYRTDYLNVPADTIVFGAGDGSVLRLNDGSHPDGGVLQIYGNGGDISGVVIANLQVDGNKANVVASGSALNIECVDVKDATGIRMHNVTVRNAVGDGIDLDDSTDCVIYASHAYDCDGWGFHFSHGAFDNKIVMSVADNCGHVHERGGFDQWHPAGESPGGKRNSYMGCTARGCYRNWYIAGEGATWIGNQSLGATTAADVTTGVADFGGPTLSDADPQPDGDVDAGTSTEVSRGDHVHPAVAATVDSHRLVVLVDDGAGGVEPLTDGDGLWLYGDYPGTEH